MAKKVKFLKDHWRHTKGESALLVDEAANYFIKCGIAVEVKNERVLPAHEEKKEIKTRGRKKKS